MRNPITNENCEKCLGDRFGNCVKGKCVHGSRLRSVLGAAEAYFWRKNGVYRYVDVFICCSAFMKKMMDTVDAFAPKTVAMLNFAEREDGAGLQKKDYVLYFGRYSEEKGIRTLAEACRQTPDIPFVFAGSGPLESLLEGVPNIENVGFKSGEELKTLIKEARFSVYPSEWYENCPFSVIESLTCKTPVLGADIGGIPELVIDGVNGELFTSGDRDDLVRHIQGLWADREKTERYAENCSERRIDDISEYYEKLIKIYLRDEGI